MEEWDTETGTRLDDSAFARENDGVYRIRFSLEAGGTKCFVLTDRSAEALQPVAVYETVAEKTLTGLFPYRRDEQNVCVLDWCRWRQKGGEWSEENEALKTDRAIRAHFGLENRGGGMLQPWFAKDFDRTQYGEIELSYTFEIEDLPEGPVFLAGERPERNHYRLNGVELRNPDVNDFWIDDCFKRMPIPAGTLKTGLNEVTVRVGFRRTTNVEALYLVGDFGVEISGRKRTLTTLPAEIGCGNYADFRMPFYTGNMTYVLAPEAYKPLVSGFPNADRIVLTPASFTGACVKVTAAGKTAVLGWEPFEADVTEAARRGLPIEVTVVGTRINVFGPLHETEKPAWACGPDNFVTSGEHWTDEYCLLASGLGGFTLKAQNRRDTV